MRRFILLAVVLVIVRAQMEDFDETVVNEKLTKKFRDCVDLRVNGGFKTSGLFYIFPNTTRLIKVVCRFELNNTFTSIMGQKDGSVSFKRGFSDYVRGFGYSQTNNFWLGLKNIQALTSIGHVNMRVTLQDWSNYIQTIYYKFSLVGSNYNAYFSQFQGSLPDDFSYNNGMPFSTYDHDLTGCATKMWGGWWYNHCTYTLPTGHYYNNGYYPIPPGQFGDGIFYTDWHGVNYSLMYIRIDLAPNP